MMGTLHELGTVREGDEDVLDSPDDVAVRIIDRILQGEAVSPHTLLSPLYLEVSSVGQ